MNNHYTFIVTSSLNTNTGVYSVDQRLQQTQETIHSIRRHVSNAVIIFIDTENPPLTEQQKLDINNLVDYYIEYTPNIFEKVLDQQFPLMLKTVGEYCLYNRALEFIIKHNLEGRRIFKISGRYRLCDSFDIAAYNNPIFAGRYVFRHKIMYVTNNIGEIRGLDFLESRLWSMCASQLKNFNDRLSEFLLYSIKHTRGIELTFWDLLDKNQIFIVPQIHVEGHFATNGEYILD